MTGINSEINSPERLTEFLKKETKGYRVTALGSSAGGYAAVLYGSLIAAERIYTFNGQFELKSLLTKSYEAVNPIIFRERDNPEINRYYEIGKYISYVAAVYSFYSRYKNDAFQCAKAGDAVKNVIAFNTRRHGLPFFKNNAGKILTMNDEELKRPTRYHHNPLRFSINLIGWRKTLQGVLAQLCNRYQNSIFFREGGK